MTDNWQHAQGCTEFRTRARTKNKLPTTFPQIFLGGDTPGLKMVLNYDVIKTQDGSIDLTCHKKAEKINRKSC